MKVGYTYHIIDSGNGTEIYVGSTHNFINRTYAHKNSDRYKEYKGKL